jgi:alginate O-acetyltransferase complex protein AlgI
LQQWNKFFYYQRITVDLSSLSFLFIFLPAFLIVFLTAQKTARLAIISIANLIFLVWGQATALWWLLLILVTTYVIGRAVSLYKNKNSEYRVWVWIAIIINILLLAFHKINSAYGPYLFPKVGLTAEWTSSLGSLVVPIGLSFVTFQSISYMVDILRRTISAESNFFKLAAYLLFFPKLVSGPLMRYKSFSEQMDALEVSVIDIASGIRRLLIGFLKRILIANQLGLAVNAAFGLPSANFAPHIAWLVLIAYSLQIYFDFSGYTDMALGLGRMMGIKLPENFNYPYLAESISDFWRRWHISLTTWFREYVFYPLERHRLKWSGQQINIIIVFVLTGLWHGFKPHFVVWGLIHGIALSSESLGFGQKIKRLWRPLRHLYTLSIVMFGWIFFRSENLRFALSFIKRLGGNQEDITVLPFSQTTPLPFIEPSFILALAIGLLLSLQIDKALKSFGNKLKLTNHNIPLGVQIAGDILLILLFILGLASILSNGFLPNIYANF